MSSTYVPRSACHPKGSSTDARPTLQWHPTQDEWSYFLEGQGRVTLFAAQSNARTFNYQAGDVGFVPASFGHYVENIGNTTLRFLEIFKSDTFQDVSLNQVSEKPHLPSSKSTDPGVVACFDASGHGQGDFEPQ